MVGNHQEVQRLVHPSAQACTAGDGFATGETVGIGGGQVVHAEQVGVERGRGVQVGVTPVHLLWVIVVRPGRIRVGAGQGGASEQ